MESPESYLRNSIRGIAIRSIADVGTGHGGVFDYGRWESYNLELKVCLDIMYIRPDISKSWNRVIASATNLPFRECCFDLVQSTEMIEHIEPEKHKQVLHELIRVAKKAVFLTSSDVTRHLGETQKKYEEWNPFHKYLGIVDVKLLKRVGFKILLEDGHRVKAFYSSYVTTAIIWIRKELEGRGLAYNPVTPTRRCHHVWDDQVQPWKPRTYRTCIKCGHIVRDFEHYVIWLTQSLPIESVVDVGTGRKGPVAERYWVNYKGIKRGYVCDVWVLKRNLNPIWVKLKVNALKLLDVLKPKSVDVVQAFGFLEHLKKEDGYRFLRVAEKLAKKLVIVSGALNFHGSTRDYKAKLNGNPYHVYRSLWSHEELERLGWQTGLEYYKRSESYMGDVIAWKIVSP